MSTLQDKIAAVSSIAFRIASYVFLRWFPGTILVPILYTLFALYIPSFISSYLTQAKFDIFSDDVEITVAGVEAEDQPPMLGSRTIHSLHSRTQGKHAEVEEEMDVEETVLLRRRPLKVWQTLLTGIPSTASTPLSLATLLINVGLILAIVDFIYRGKIFHPSDDLSFARVGYVSDTEAKLLIREPDQSKYPILVSLKVHNHVPAHDHLGWQWVGGINFSSNNTDYATVVHIPLPKWDLLRPLKQRKYLWATSNNRSGSFTAAPRPGVRFEDNDGKFTFLTSSCILPHFPYNPFNHGLSVPGFKHLASLLPDLHAQFMLFLGDFIYVDVPKRFGTSVENYQREYRQVYASPDWSSVGQNLSWIHVLDDHELADNWDNGTSGIYEAAISPWNHYQAAANPPLAEKAGVYRGVRTEQTYFEFTHGPASFFMLDTRKYRNTANGLPANSTEKTMLGDQQLADFLTWLRRPVPKGVNWKVIASSVPFTKNWPINRMDTWGGYLNERQKILETMWDVGMQAGIGVVVISGDRHEFAAVKFPPPPGGKWPTSATVHEFSTSPLNQFYSPFPSYHQTDDEDVLIKYIPAGNSKFGAVTINNHKTNNVFHKRAAHTSEPPT